MMTSGNVQACQFKSCKSVFLGWHQGSDQRAPDSGRAQRAAPEPAEVAQGGLGSHEGRDRRDDHGSHPQGECPTGARQVQDLARGPKGQHQAPSRPVRKHVNVGDDVDEDCKEKTKISDLLWRVAKHERNYLKKFFPQTNPKLLFVPTKVEANLFEVDKDRQETGGEDQQSLTMKKIWIKSRNAWKKIWLQVPDSAAAVSTRGSPQVDRNVLFFGAFFSSRICSVPSFRVSSLPKPGFIVIPHSLVANRRNKTWKLFFSTHTNKKYSSLQTNFPPKTRIKLLKKT